MSMLNETFEKVGGTRGTEGTTTDGAASRGSPGVEPEGTRGTFDPLDGAIDPLDDPAGAELNDDLAFPGEDARPAWTCYWDWCGPLREDGRRRHRPGVYYHGMSKAKGDLPSLPFDLLVCSPLEVAAITATDDAHQTFGLLLEFRDLNGKTRRWAMPRNMLRGSCEELRGELLDQGVEIHERSRLAEWLQYRPPKRRVVAATTTDWAAAGKSFVLPYRVIGDQREVIYQSESATTDGAASARGELSIWRDQVAALCVGNPVLALSVCAALAGPLLAKVHHHSAGIHWTGDSSTGKTTALHVGASVWGGSAFVRTWRATANGLEGAAAALNDTLLCLDEISEADPKQVGEIVYSIANGIGKSRATRIGAARRIHRWRLTLLSTGERTLRATMAEGGKQAKAGQEVRLLNIPAARAHGAFDVLHGFADGRALSDHLKSGTAEHHGHAGPAFVERLLGDTRDLGGELKQVMDMPCFAAPDSQAGRAAKSFAMFGLAGELAIGYGILPWPTGEAVRAAATGYQLWLSARGAGLTEHRQILDSIADFIARHGDSRFSEKGRDLERPVQNRAGWWMTDNTGERIHLFNAPGLREAGGGFDMPRILAALDQAGWIADRGSDKHAKKTHIGPGQKSWLYYIKVREVAA